MEKACFVFIQKQALQAVLLKLVILMKIMIHFLDKGYDVLGVSADNSKRQLNFKNKYGFRYHLLADEHHDVIKPYGV